MTNADLGHAEIRLVDESPKPEAALCDPSSVATAQRLSISLDQAVQVAQLFKLLGDPNRTRILHTLVTVEEMCVGDLAAVCDVTETVVSHSLRLLRAAGAVSADRRGRRVHYRLVDPHLANVILMTLATLGPTSAPAAASADPATPDPASAELATPDPATPDPATPDPATPDPATPGSASTEPAAATATRPLGDAS